VDGRGNVYVVGRSVRGGFVDWDYALVKYSRSGRRLWVRRQPITSFLQPNGDYAKVHLAVSVGGQAWVAADGPDGGLTAKYEADGRLAWSRSFRASPDSIMAVGGLAIDPRGNAYLAGSTGGVFASVSGIVVVKYGPDGRELRVSVKEPEEGLTGGVAAIVVDASGAAYVTARSIGSELSPYPSDCLTLKYGPDGAPLWYARWDSREVNSSETPVAIAVDGAGNVFVAGSVEQTGFRPSADYLTLKYDAGGDLLWAARFDGPRSLEDRAVGLGVDAFGAAYVAGTVDITPGEWFEDFATVKYDASGALSWADYYDGPAGAIDKAAGIAVDAGGNAAVAGITALRRLPNVVIDYGFASVRYAAGQTDPVLSGLTLRSTSIRAGALARGAVWLSGPALTTSYVTLASSNPEVLPAPAEGVKVRRGRSSAQLRLRARAVAEPTDVTLTASYGGVSRQLTITVRPR
jgi:hypothetical protein